MRALPAAFQPGSHQQTRMGGSEGLMPAAALLLAPAASLQAAQIAAAVAKQSFAGKSQKA